MYLIALPRRTSGGFSGRATSFVGDPAFELAGTEIVAEFTVVLTRPAAATFPLSPVARDGLDSGPLVGTPDPRWGRIRSHSGLMASLGIGGLDGGATLTLEIDDGLGSGGPGRRWSDRFAANVPGYAEPYDLESAQILAYLRYRDRTSGQDVVRPRGVYRVTTGGARWGPDTLTLECREEDRHYRLLPRRTLTKGTDWPDLPAESEGLGIPLLFGDGQTVRLIPVDGDGRLHLVGEDSAETPLGGVVGLHVLTVDPETQEPVALEVDITTAIPPPDDESPGTPSFSIPGDGSSETLTELAMRFLIPGKARLAYGLRLTLRRTGSASGAGAISGVLTEDKDGLPDESRAVPGAAGELDAGLVTSATFSDFDLLFQSDNVPRSVVVPGDRYLHAVVKYANDAGGALAIERHATGPYADGYLCRKDTTLDEWVPTGRQSTRRVTRRDLTGIGALHRRDGVADGGDDGAEPVSPYAPLKYPGGRRVAYVGRAVVKGVPGTGRVFLRFKISDLGAAAISARLRVFLVTRAPLTTGSLRAVELDGTGFGGNNRLDATDWTLAEASVLHSTFLTDASETGQWHSIDVTTAYNAAKTAGRTHFVVKLDYSDESHPIGRYYVVELGGRGPRLVVTKTTGRDMKLGILAATVTVTPQNTAASPASPLPVLTVEIGDEASPGLAPGVVLAATVDGFADDAAGTYTGTPGARITHGPDIIRFLALAASDHLGCGMTPGQLNAATFDRARTQLAAESWPALVGRVDGPARDPWTVWARIARCCRCALYVDWDGRLALVTEGPGESPVRTVRAEEHGPITLEPVDTQPRPAMLEVFYGFDPLSLPNAPDATGGRAAADWNGYAIIHPDQTEPPDPVRQAQAVEARLRYGERALGPLMRGSPGDETTYEWMPVETGGAETGLRLLRTRWDHLRVMPQPGRQIAVALPRYALTWEPGSTFDLESYQLPGAAARMVPGSVEWARDARFLGFPDQLTTASGLVWHLARGARCQVRSIVLNPEPGAAYPVRVTAVIRGWNTA